MHALSFLLVCLACSGHGEKHLDDCVDNLVVPRTCMAMDLEQQVEKMERVVDEVAQALTESKQELEDKELAIAKATELANQTAEELLKLQALANASARDVQKVSAEDELVTTLKADAVEEHSQSYLSLMQKKKAVSPKTVSLHEEEEEEEEVLKKDKLFRQIQDQHTATLEVGLSCLNGAVGSSGPTPVDLAAAEEVVLARSKIDSGDAVDHGRTHASGKRKLAIHTSDPVEPQLVTNTDDSNKVPTRRTRGRGDNGSQPAPPAPPVRNGSQPAWSMPTDLYVPAHPKSAKVAPVWHFFRRSRAEDEELGHRVVNSKAYCQIANCPRPVLSGVGGTTNLWNHLWRVHNLPKAAVKAQAEGRCQCGACPDLSTPHGITGNREETLQRERQERRQQAAVDAAECIGEASTPTQKVLLWLPSHHQRLLDQSLTRNVIVPGLRVSRLAEQPLFQIFLTHLAAISGASHQYRAPNHQRIDRVVNADTTTLYEQMRALLQTVPTCGLTLHWDVWTDQWKRPWLLSYVFFLHPDTWSPTNMCICFKELSGWSDPEIGGSHSAAVGATALRNAWRQRIQTELPPAGCSDNTASSVNIGSLLEMRTYRCLVHLLHIPIRRLLFDVVPEAFRALREFASYYHHKHDHIASFKRHQTRSELPGRAPVLDSSSKWESTLRLVQALHDSQALWALVASRDEMGQHPDFLTPEQVVQVLDTLPVLQAIHASTLLLEQDSSLAADFIPIVHALRQQLQGQSEFADSYLLELERAMERHLGGPVDASAALGSAWSSMRELLECSSMMHPAYRQGLFLDDATRLSRQRRLGGFLLSRFLLYNNLDDPEAQMPQELMTVQGQAAPVQRQPQRNTPGMEGILSSLAALSSGIAASSVAPQAEAQHTQDISIIRYVDRQLKAHVVAAPSTMSVSDYWCNTELITLVPGAYLLLSHSSGNAHGERVFSRTGHALSAKNLAHADIEKKLLLRQNAALLQLPGYTSQMPMSRTPITPTTQALADEPPGDQDDEENPDETNMD